MQTPADTRSRCDAEARKLYAALLGREIPAVLLDRYAAACERLHATLDPAEVDRCQRAIAGGDDLEALEAAARYTHKLPLLSRKFRLMAYLAETLPENQPAFVNRRSSLCAGLWQSAWAVLRTPYKLAAGLVRLRRAPHA